MQRNKGRKTKDWEKMPFKALKNDDEFDRNISKLYNSAKSQK